MAQPTPLEQEMLELVNRMRTDPASELSLLINSSDPDVNSAIEFFNVNLDVLADQWSTLVPVEPLAWSDLLNESADGHNQLMIEFDEQSHNLPGEPSLLERIGNTGYDFSTASESIFAFTTSPFQGHAAFAIDWGGTDTGIQDPPGHREAIMNSGFRELGIAITPENDDTTNVGPLVVTQHFGNRFELNNQSWLLGTAFQDLDEDSFYDAGEGLNNITINITGVSDPTFNNTLTSWETGGYQILLDPGEYQVEFLQDGTVIQAAQNVTVGTENVKVDLVQSADVTPLPTISLSETSGTPNDGAIQFTTALSQFRNATDSNFIRPSSPDAQQSFTITNTGDAPLTISEIQINAPNVTASLNLTSDPADDLVLQPGVSRDVQLTYSPSVAGENLSMADGLIIFSDATNTPQMALSLSGQSTFNSDINYDGQVNLGDLAPLNVSFGTVAGSPNWDPTADINGDGQVNLGDLAPLNVEFGSVLA